jgi:hypothetical protein
MGRDDVGIAATFAMMSPPSEIDFNIRALLFVYPPLNAQMMWI